MNEETMNTMQLTNSTPEDNGGQGGRLFTQDEVNRIVSDRLAQERTRNERKAEPQEDEREKALKAREARMDCREYIASKKYPDALLEVLDISDAEKFKATADKLAKQFPAILGEAARPHGFPQFGGETFGTMPRGGVNLADAFKPPKI